MKSSKFSVFLVSLLFLAACAQKREQKPMISNLQVTQTGAIITDPIQVRRMSIPGANRSVTSEVTFIKSEVLNREFMYGSDLQYSAINDAEYELTLQSMTIGHVVVSFRVVGSTLQIVADQRMGFESDINHPERLIHEFRILRQDDHSITVVIERGSPTLVTVLGDAESARERSSWVRSVNYVADGNYLMFESSIEAADGSITEFMESLFPRETLVPAGYVPLLADSALEPLAERFRFLSWGDVFIDIPQQGRVATRAANRYLLAPNQIITWYVTPNVPDEYLDQVRTGIEGWNRYSQSMWGRNMLRFNGKLPDGIKVGDPRYNVVNWDNVAEAGAAYESQASDPLTGLQSHSLIYLPLAWVNIGKQFWKAGEFSDVSEARVNALANHIEKRSYLSSKLAISCLDNGLQHISLQARQNPDQFARTLLKGVLFHEMGHALGLAHNFKGSLSFEDSNPATFSTSIMDYNQYNIERRAYSSVESADGPLLEYDRQILSVLYNGGHDVRESDPVVPACDDDEADSRDDGVDPLCLRYDSGKEPTVQMQKALRLIQDETASIGETRSLPTALRDIQNELGDATLVTTVDQAKEKIKNLATALQGTVAFYTVSGAQSLYYMTKANLLSLYIFKPDSLPETYVESEMRARVMETVKTIAAMNALPQATLEALEASKTAAVEWLATTAAIQSVSETDRQGVTNTILAPLGALDEFIGGAGSGAVLTKLRSRVLGALVRVPASPFHLSRIDGALVDFEQEALNLLRTNITTTTSDKTRAFVERMASATALVTFKDTEAGEEVVDAVIAVLRGEMASTADARLREDLRNLVKKLREVPGAR